MSGKGKRLTKLKLDDIPKVGTAGRKIMLLITRHEEYKKAIEEGIPAFYEEELSEIEKKYSDGISQIDAQRELKKKGLAVKQSVIQHYIKVGQLPKPREARRKTKKGAISLYPSSFIRHLNLVRFAMIAGRKVFDEILNAELGVDFSDYFLLQHNTDDECYEWYDDGFFGAFVVSLWRFEEFGLSYASDAIEKAFKPNAKKQEKYRKRLERIRKIKNKLEAEVKKFEEEAKENGRLSMLQSFALSELLNPKQVSGEKK